MNAKGYLKHHFHGEYYARVILTFASEDCARGALELLPGWKHAGNCLGADFNSSELDAFKAKIKSWHLEIEPCGFSHCADQCRHAEIDSVNHSIDYGPTFTLNLPAVSIAQGKFSFASPVQADL